MKFSPKGTLRRLFNVVVGSFTPKDPGLYRSSLAEVASGVEVSVPAAMQHDAVWSCVKLIATSIAALPLNLMMREGKDVRVASRHSLQYLLHDMPNSASTAVMFWESVVSAMLLRGNAFIEKKTANGKVVSLLFLAPHRLQIVCDVNGKRTYHYYDENGKQREIPRDRIWQIQGYSMDGKDGVSVITYAAQVFGNALAADRQAGRTFRNGSMANVYYKVAAFLTDEQRDQFKQNVQDSVESGKAPILEGGVDVEALGIKPSDAQLLESRSYSVETICRWFGVPPSMVGHDGKTTAWGTGIEQQMLGFLTFTLTPWLVRIEQSITLNLLRPDERSRYFAKFETTSLIRADSKATAEYLVELKNGGIMTADEARVKLGLPEMGGNASELLVQGAMILLGSLSKEPQDDNAPASAQPQPDTGAGNLESAAAQLRAAILTLGGNSIDRP